MGAMTFQKQFALAVCITLECRFRYNLIMKNFRMFGPTNMHYEQVGLAN